jgi:hypothetical protein
MASQHTKSRPSLGPYMSEGDGTKAIEQAHLLEEEGEASDLCPHAANHSSCS